MKLDILGDTTMSTDKENAMTVNQQVEALINIGSQFGSHQSSVINQRYDATQRDVWEFYVQLEHSIFTNDDEPFALPAVYHCRIQSIYDYQIQITEVSTVTLRPRPTAENMITAEGEMIWSHSDPRNLITRFIMNSLTSGTFMNKKRADNWVVDFNTEDHLHDEVLGKLSDFV